MPWGKARRAAHQSGNPLVAVRLTVAHRAAVKRIARDLGMSVSAFIRSRLIDGVYNPEPAIGRTFQPAPDPSKSWVTNNPDWHTRRQAKRQDNSARYLEAVGADWLERARLKRAGIDPDLPRTLTDKPRGS
jgi:hypothetical protein